MFNENNKKNFMVVGSFMAVILGITTFYTCTFIHDLVAPYTLVLTLFIIKVSLAGAGILILPILKKEKWAIRAYQRLNNNKYDLGLGVIIYVGIPILFPTLVWILALHLAIII